MWAIGRGIWKLKFFLAYIVDLNNFFELKNFLRMQYGLKVSFYILKNWLNYWEKSDICSYRIGADSFDWNFFLIWLQEMYENR